MAERIWKSSNGARPGASQVPYPFLCIMSQCQPNTFSGKICSGCCPTKRKCFWTVPAESIKWVWRIHPPAVNPSIFHICHAERSQIRGSQQGVVSMSLHVPATQAGFKWSHDFTAHPNLQQTSIEIYAFCCSKREVGGCIGWKTC